jgi:hypothetical protein
MEFAVFVVIFALLLIIPACFRAAARSRQEQQQHAEGLSEFRQQQQSQRRAGATVTSTAPSTTPTPTAPTEEETLASRKVLIQKHLYSRKLQHGESVRNLIMLLSAANDRYQDEEKGNIILKSWRSAEASVNKFVGSKPECSICLDPYEANETVCWAKNDDCDHIFHQDCIVTWLQDHDECPLCRTNLLVYEGAEHAEDADAGDESMRT